MSLLSNFLSGASLCAMLLATTDLSASHHHWHIHQGSDSSSSWSDSSSLSSLSDSSSLSSLSDSSSSWSESSSSLKSSSSSSSSEECQRVPFSIAFTLTTDPIPVYGDRVLLEGTYTTTIGNTTYPNPIVIDTGTFTNLITPLGLNNDNCNPLSQNNFERINLFGVAGIAVIDVRARTAEGLSNGLHIVYGEGVYDDWKGARNIVVIPDCETDALLISGTVKLCGELPLPLVP